MKTPSNKLASDVQIFRTLELLGVLLGQRTTDHVSLVVCGGSALIALGLIPRTTKDVDVVAILEGERLVSASKMPSALVESARLVALE
jgi:hypothetical protein